MPIKENEKKDAVLVTTEKDYVIIEFVMSGRKRVFNLNGDEKAGVP